MEIRRKQSKIYRNEIMQMPICRDKERKLKYTELKYCRCHYGEAKKAKENIQN